eukprot:scaffold16791_cov151-Isochrysis_galbana.AAC.2
MYLPRITLRALVTMGLTLLESIRTAMATPLEGSSLVAGEWTTSVQRVRTRHCGGLAWGRGLQIKQFHQRREMAPGSEDRLVSGPV